MLSGMFIQCRIGLINKEHTRVKARVTTVLNIVETTTEFLTPFISFAPYLCPVITANPLVKPTIIKVIRKNTGATAPTAAKDSTPKVLPTMTRSAMLYNC